MLTEQEARDGAHTLVTRMGEGWESRVWENLGWHYSVKKGCVRITVNHDWLDGGAPSYTAWIEPTNVLIRMAALQIIAHGPNPEDALGNAVQDARTIMARLTDALDQLREMV